MAEFPSMPLWTDAYLADTGELTALEHGAYLMLLIAMWRAGGYLPNIDVKLARVAKVSTRQWPAVKAILWGYFTVENDTITQGRLLDELAKARLRSTKAAESARAKHRKTLKSPPANASSEHSSRPATTSTSITIDTEDTSLRSVRREAPKTAKGTRISVDWVLTKEWGDWAVQELGASPALVRSEAEKFKDFWLSKVGKDATKADWQATWRNWMRRAVESGPQQRAGPAPHSGKMTAADIFRQMKERSLEQLHEQERNEGRGADIGADGNPVLLLSGGERRF